MSFPLFRDTIASFGLCKEDAEVIADCMVTKKVCSWVNTEPVDQAHISRVNDFIQQSNVPIFVNVTSVPTRNKFIWEVKHKK